MWGDIGYLISPSNLSHLGRIRVAIVNRNYIQRSVLSLALQCGLCPSAGPRMYIEN